MNEKKKSIIIEDNCHGITNFEKVVKEIGNSDKKAQPWTNGQFGYGIYSFMAACESLNIITKLQSDPFAKQITINRSQFDTDDIEDVIFDDPIEAYYKHLAGTGVELSEFDKEMWSTIEFETIQNEIELHFELLLKRSNFKIQLIGSNNELYTCEPFDYQKYTGEEYSEKLNELDYKKGGKKPSPITVKLTTPITIFLKVTDERAINKPPVFISKGRRIAAIKDIRNFNSNRKGEIWGNPNLTGYIDLSDFLEPTIDRRNFKNNRNARALFYTLKELEPLILDVIGDVRKDSETQHYKSFEDHINRMLRKIARQDKMFFQTEILSGNEINVLPGASGQENEEHFGSEHHRNGPPSGVPIENPSEPEDDPYGFGSTEEAGNNVSDHKDDGDLASNNQPDNEYEDTGLKGRERKKPGFNMQFVEGDPIIDEETNKPLRSQLVGGTIRIFRNHPDFESRVQTFRSKEPKITPRLNTYVALQTMVHYKDRQQMREGQAEYNIQMYISLTEYVLRLEDLCSGLVGKNLKDFMEK